MSSVNQISSDSYVLLSVVKNEGKHLNKTIESVAKQSIQPSIWAIFDDNSTDDTPGIIIEAHKQYDWILYSKLDEVHKRDLGLHLANLIKKGLEYLVDYCKINQIDYEYLGNLDGDLILTDHFFEKLIHELKSDRTIGIVSGDTQYLINEKLVPSGVNSEEPSGGHMLIKKKCFEDCGGIMVAYSWDSVLKAKASLRGWSTMRIKEANVIEVRDISSADGYWNGYVFNGKSAYYRDLNPLHVIGKSFIYCLKYPHYIGFAYLYGYVLDLIKRKDKIDDEELKKYYRNKLKHSINNKGKL